MVKEDFLIELEEGLSDKDWKIRLRATEDARQAMGFGLEKKVLDSTIEILASHLEDKKWEVRRGILFALAATHDKKAKKYIQKCIEDNTRWVRQAATTLLQKFTPYPPVAKEDSTRNYVFSLVKDRGAALMSREELYEIAILAGNRFYEELAGDTFHEVFNAIKPVSGYVRKLKEHISENGNLDARAKELIGKIEKQFEHLHTLLWNLRDYSQEYSEDFEVVSLNAVLAESLEQALEKSKRAVATEEIEKEIILDDEFMVDGNKPQLVSLFTNLISNALESMKKDGKLAVIARRREDTIEIIISDRQCNQAS